jgi:hypothetical protein
MKPHQHASLRTAIEMKLTDHIVTSPGPVTATELAEITKGDKLLIGTHPHPTCSSKYIEEAGCAVNIK